MKILNILIISACLLSQLSAQGLSADQKSVIKNDINSMVEFFDEKEKEKWLGCSLANPNAPQISGSIDARFKHYVYYDMLDLAQETHPKSLHNFVYENKYNLYCKRHKSPGFIERSVNFFH